MTNEIVVITFILFLIPYSLQQGLSCTMNSDCVEENEACSTTNRCSCINGYMREGSLCVDIDECSCSTTEAQCREVCEDGGGVCSLRRCLGDNEVCDNVAGSFTCGCETGFNRMDNNFCVDINECALGDCSDDLQTCTNTPGSFLCECDSGYSLIQDTITCVESCNERCDAETEICMENPIRCVCKVGYYNLTDNTCTDRNECTLDPPPCPGDNVECVNNVGSFTCQCQTGYEMINNGCLDIQECEDRTKYCMNADGCMNTEGSYTCTCNANKLLDNDRCFTFNDFRVKILATELNITTVSQYDTSQDEIYEYHFCKIIIDNVRDFFSNGIYDCNHLKFEGGPPFIGYLQLRVANVMLTAANVKSALEENVIRTTTGRQLLRSNDFVVSITLSNDEDSLDVVDRATYTNPCPVVPNPCQNNALCQYMEVINDVNCTCTGSFSGERCQIGNNVNGVIEPTTAAGTTRAPGINTEVLVIIAVSAGSVIVLLLLCCCCCCMCVFMRRGSGQPSFQHNNVAPRTYPGRATIRAIENDRSRTRSEYSYQARSVA